PQPDDLRGPFMWHPALAHRCKQFPVDRECDRVDAATGWLDRRQKRLRLKVVDATSFPLFDRGHPLVVRCECESAHLAFASQDEYRCGSERGWRFANRGDVPEVNLVPGRGRGEEFAVW